MDNELYHFGIKGKSGRYPKGSGVHPRAGKKPSAVKAYKKDRAADLSNEELQARNKRIQLESTYNNAVHKPGLLQDVGKQLVRTALVAAGTMAINKGINASIGKMSASKVKASVSNLMGSSSKPSGFANTPMNSFVSPMAHKPSGANTTVSSKQLSKALQVVRHSSLGLFNVGTNIGDLIVKNYI